MNGATDSVGKMIRLRDCGARRDFVMLAVLGSTALSGCAVPLTFVATATPSVVDLSNTEGRYPIRFDLTLTNRGTAIVEYAPAREEAIRVEYLRRAGILVTPAHEGTALCCEGTDRDVPCRCELQKPTQLRPVETAKQSLDGLSFVYCDRRGVESGVEYRPAPGRYSIRFSYRAHGVKALSNEVFFEIRGR
jgi:hypothetical protein